MRISFDQWDNSIRARCAAAALDADEVQVWTAAEPLKDADLSAMIHLLSAEERGRADRFGVREARRQFVFGRVLIRQIFGACLNCEPGMVSFGCQLRGKPFLIQHTRAGDFRFNLSHSGGLAVMALARGREVGVDIERVQVFDDWPVLAGRIFSPQELCELRSLPDAQQQEAFFAGWTRKEAYLKATGIGLTDDLAAIEVSLTPGKAPQLLRLPTGPEDHRLWGIRSLPLPSGFAGALVFSASSSGTGALGIPM
jgi:4'-phosphopantetheinyl transferase